MNIDSFRLFNIRRVFQYIQTTSIAERQVSQQMQRLALRSLFQRPEFSGQDGLNEYDHDYTRFTAMKDLVTREMQQAMARRGNAGPDASAAVARAEDDLDAASGNHDGSSAGRA
ncbi:DUF3306 domain-containing protein [Thiolapillus sp.]|uniref:DUF3306 domain-containing protein n=1 Tax=Thiolapillus sp. TaxID=2017437 RepID=UPI003AF55EE7